MNQAILFSDDRQWQSAIKSIYFVAQVMGNQIQCCISAQKLSELAQKNIENEAQALLVFQTYQFDIEELAEQAILNEDYDQQGKIQL